jgi:salicylate hydroxylase
MIRPKILIAGAGIGGLATACCLLKRGFDVEVYEQAPALSEVGAGIQISANAMHVLRIWGSATRSSASGCSLRPMSFACMIRAK